MQSETQIKAHPKADETITSEMDRLLDEALRMTFPASDPVALRLDTLPFRAAVQAPSQVADPAVRSKWMPAG